MTQEEFDKLVQEYKLELVTEEKCDICDCEREVYTSKYSDNIYGLYCNSCNYGMVSVELKSGEPNVCPICGLLVEYEDKDEDDFIECDYELCNQKAHMSCIDESICPDCNVWVCDDHSSSTENLECDHCGQYHSPSCIVSLGGDFVDALGIICSPCFNRDEELFKEIKKPFTAEDQKDILEQIDKNKHFYVTEARENFDLTIVLTHLIRSSASDKPYEVLKLILSEGKLKGSITGYYGKINQTKSVCFADLTIRGLYRHSKKYSQFGIAFPKEIVFSRGGAPAMYIREDLLKSARESLPDSLKPFVNKINIESYDFHHEREWRVPEDFSFTLGEISVLYAPSTYHAELRNLFPEIRYMIDLDFIQMI